MDLPSKIAGLDPRRVRTLFQQLLKEKIKLEWHEGVLKPAARRMTEETVGALLELSADDARTVHQALIAEGWLQAKKLTPTRSGMGLAQHVDRPKLARADAEFILERVLQWADQTNAAKDARVKIRTIVLFGSLESRASEVSDIDLFVDFTTMDLGMQLMPEDIEREDELCEELAAIPEYLSPSSIFDSKLMGDVPQRQVFPRKP